MAVKSHVQGFEHPVLIHGTKFSFNQNEHVNEVKIAGSNKACKHKRVAGTSRNYC